MTYSTNIVNLTPHSVTLLSWSTNTPREVFPASGVVARCVVERHSVANAIGLPLFTASFGEVVGLPDHKEGNLYIVSAIVRNALPERRDLFSPADLERDEEGNITGCKSLDCNP